MKSKVSIFLMVCFVASLCIIAIMANTGDKPAFARVTITQSKIESYDEMVNLYEESVVPAAKSQKGYLGILSPVEHRENLLADRHLHLFSLSQLAHGQGSCYPFCYHFHSRNDLI